VSVLERDFRRRGPAVPGPLTPRFVTIGIAGTITAQGVLLCTLPDGRSVIDAGGRLLTGHPVGGPALARG
jgi:hypothetical protein